MEFDNNFTVQAPLVQVWAFMLDVRQVAPCVPGAQLTEVIDESHYKGTVKIKLGAVQVTYRGQLGMESDEQERTITLHVKGTEARGSGGASGTITSRLIQTKDGETAMEIHSRVDVTGRVAQFGRGIMQDVATRLIRQFADCIEATLGGQPKAASPEATPTSRSDSEPVPLASSGDAPGPAMRSPVPVPAGTTPLPSRAVARAEPAPPAGTEFSMTQVLLDVFRGRMAAALRVLADYLEPRPKR